MESQQIVAVGGGRYDRDHFTVRKPQRDPCVRNLQRR